MLRNETPLHNDPQSTSTMEERERSQPLGNKEHDGNDYQESQTELTPIALEDGDTPETYLEAPDGVEFASGQTERLTNDDSGFLGKDTRDEGVSVRSFSWQQATLMIKSLTSSVLFPQQHPIRAKGQQPQKLLEIGTTLREMRLSQCLPLETIANKTLISLRQLEAIESGDLTTLPEPVYIRGFIKQYADTLGLDGNELAHRFPLTGKMTTMAIHQHLQLPSFKLRPLHLYILYIVLVFFTVQGISSTLEQEIRQMAQPATSSQQQPSNPQ